MLLISIRLLLFLCRMLCFNWFGMSRMFLVWLVFIMWCVWFRLVGWFMMCIVLSVFMWCSSLWLVVFWFRLIIMIGRLLVIWCWYVVG